MSTPQSPVFDFMTLKKMIQMNLKIFPGWEKLKNYNTNFNHNFTAG